MLLQRQPQLLPALNHPVLAAQVFLVQVTVTKLIRIKNRLTTTLSGFYLGYEFTNFLISHKKH